MPRWLAGLTFFATIVVSWGGLHAYCYHRFAAGFDLNTRARLVFKIVLVVLALLYLAGRFVEATWSSRGALALLWPGALWMGLFALLISCLVSFDLFVSVPAWLLRHAGVLGADFARSIARYGLMVVLVLSLVLGGWGVARALGGLSVTRIAVDMPGLPPSLEGFSLVVVSDIHTGDLVSHQYVDRVAQLIDAQQADLIVLVGDLTDERNGGDGTVLDRLAAIRAKYGVLAVTGNHEAYAGGERLVRTIQAHGIPVLRQEHRVIANGLIVAGVDDPTFLGGRQEVRKAIDLALMGRREDLPVVLLAHQPVAVEHAAAQGVALMLSGHTHGGQLPPFQLLTGLAYGGFLRGLHRVGNLQLYVNNGAGYWGPPIRVFADPEIVHLTLRAAPKNGRCCATDR